MTTSFGGLRTSRRAVLVSLLLVTTTTTTRARQPSRRRAADAACAAPSDGCKSGLWTPSECACLCIPPFCPDSGGVCSTPGGNCFAVNPWTDCDVGTNCPWWKSTTEPGACATGQEVSPGIWDVYATEGECCRVHHPDSEACKIPTDAPTPSSVDALVVAVPIEDDPYVTVPIKFSVGGLPSEVNMRELKAEMLEELKRILVDLAGRVKDLKINNVEENLALSVQNGANGDAGEDANGNVRREVFYDVTVVRQSDKKFEPIIIAGLRESYDMIIQHVEDYTNHKYFGLGVDLNWCADADDRGTFDMCARVHEKVEVKFRLANLPVELDVEKLIEHMAGIVKTVLEEGGIEKLDIVDVAQREVMGNETLKEYDVLDAILDVTVVRKFGVIDFGPAINNVLLNETVKNDVLNGIQRYTDTSTNLDLLWCIDAEDGAYAVCPQPIQPPRFALPDWAIITLTVLSVVLACCICACIATYIKQRNEYQNERNMMSYIETGQNYSKHRKRVEDYSEERRQLSRQRKKLTRPQRRRSSPQPPTYRQRRHHGGDERRTRPKSHHRPRGGGRNKKSHPKHRMLENGQSHRRPRSRGGPTQHPALTNGDSRSGSRGGSRRRDGPSQHLALTNGESRNMPRGGRGNGPPKHREAPRSSTDQTWAEEDGEQPQRLTIANDTTYQMENMPSFVFNHDGDGNDSGLPPPPPKEGPDVSEEMLMIEGPWFVDDDEESVLTPPRCR